MSVISSLEHLDPPADSFTPEDAFKKIDTLQEISDLDDVVDTRIASSTDPIFFQPTVDSSFEYFPTQLLLKQMEYEEPRIEEDIAYVSSVVAGAKCLLNLGGNKKSIVKMHSDAVNEPSDLKWMPQVINLHKYDVSTNSGT